MIHSSHIADEEIQYVYFGIPDCVCAKCGANMWYEERVREEYNASNPLFHCVVSKGG